MTLAGVIIIALCSIATVFILWPSKEEREEHAQQQAEIEAAWAELRAMDEEIERRPER